MLNKQQSSITVEYNSGYIPMVNTSEMTVPLQKGVFYEQIYLWSCAQATCLSIQYAMHCHIMNSVNGKVLLKIKII